MSQPVNAITPSLFTTPKPAAFTVTNSTIAKVLVEPVVDSAASGNLPAFFGGQTVLDLTASSTDAAAKEVILYQGNVLTTQDATATGSITLSAQNLLTRVNGSYITDGWLVGDALMLFTPRGTVQVVAGIDGILGIATAITALTLTVNGTPFAAGTNVLTAGTRIVNVSLISRNAIAANSGNAAGTPNVSLLANLTNDSTKLTTEWKLGSTTMLIAAMAAAVSALPAQVMVCPRSIARY